MADADYIPRSDADFRVFMETFVSGIAGDPARYGLAAGEVATLQIALNTFDDAFYIGRNTPPRSSVTDGIDVTTGPLKACYALPLQFTSRASMSIAKAARCMPLSVDARRS
jgi:hypothetical protein